MELFLKTHTIFTKKSYFNNLDVSRINDNRSFWKTIFPLFLKKTSNLNLIEEGKNVSDNAELHHIFNYFSEIISNLKIPILIPT